MDFGPILILVLVIIGVGMWFAVRGKAVKNQKPSRRQSYAMASLSPQQFKEHWQRIEGIMSLPGLEQTKSAIF